MGRQEFEVLDGIECDHMADEYSMLKGPDNFECILTEPEDREWSRDLSKVVVKLNSQQEEIRSLKSELEHKDKTIRQALTLLRKWNDSLALQILEDVLNSYNEK